MTVSEPKGAVPTRTVATALAPMIITAYYNLSAAENYVNDVELRNLEQLAQSTAGRISQLIADMRGLADYLGEDAAGVRAERVVCVVCVCVCVCVGAMQSICGQA